MSKLGFDKTKIEVHDQKDYLYGYQGDRREQKANIIIRRKYVGGAANDIGFELQEDGTYIAHISDYDRRRYGSQWTSQLELEYGIEQAKTAFSNEGWTYTETVDENNDVQLVGTKLGDY